MADVNSEAPWAREYWSPGGGDALLFYVIYGDVDVDAPVGQYYRTEQLPEELDVRLLTRSANAAYIESCFEEGSPWDHFVKIDPQLATVVKQSSSCLILQGRVTDPRSLEYLRNVVGLITFFLDHGGIAVYDIQIMKWWSPAEWRRDIFDPDAPVPLRQTFLMYSDDDDQGVGRWFHTRGMRKFGRPDISVRDVPPHEHDVVARLCNRLIEYQAYGAVISDGETVRITGLNRVVVARRAGDYDDDNFNNVHLEIEWLGDA